MARTYIPTLVAIARRFCKFVARYSEQLTTHLTEDQKDKLDVAVAACIELTDAIGALPIGD